jgi:2-polyprenyl-3-methyl-5-hydroxy-6-metoxy-1,4-benzoquinol methylase
VISCSIVLPRITRSFSSRLPQETEQTIKADAKDYIVPADVIEHAADPRVFIEASLLVCNPDARISFYIPDIGYMAARQGMMQGRFANIDSGILGKTRLSS